MRRAVLVPVLFGMVLVGGGAIAGCSDSGDAGCASSTCHLTLKEGESLTLNGQKFTIDRIDDDHVTFDSHGVSFVLNKNTDLGLGRYHLHLGGINGASASVDMTK